MTHGEMPPRRIVRSDEVESSPRSPDANLWGFIFITNYLADAIPNPAVNEVSNRFLADYTAGKVSVLSMQRGNGLGVYSTSDFQTLILPSDFATICEYRPSLATMDLVGPLSYAHDLLAPATWDTKAAMLRADAYTAEVAGTFIAHFNQDDFTERVAECLDRFPSGLMSLPSGLRPVWMRDI